MEVKTAWHLYLSNDPHGEVVISDHDWRNHVCDAECEVDIVSHTDDLKTCPHQRCVGFREFVAREGPDD